MADRPARPRPSTTSTSAHRLQPGNWTYKRQAWSLVGNERVGGEFGRFVAGPAQGEEDDWPFVSDFRSDIALARTRASTTPRPCEEGGGATPHVGSLRIPDAGNPVGKTEPATRPFGQRVSGGEFLGRPLACMRDRAPEGPSFPAGRSAALGQPARPANVADRPAGAGTGRRGPFGHRHAVEAGDPRSASARAHVLAGLEQRRLLQPVINATGVLLHTNMGRAPLAVQRPAGYTNLELDLGQGQRGDRSAHAGRFLAKAGGAEAALVVNNGAAAIFLVLAALAVGKGREVIVSRGELVEIGGGFRIPDVLESSGARLVEVGTTNRTRPSDYRGALGENTALLLKVHTSNYRMTGFVAAVSMAELVELGGRPGAASGFGAGGPDGRNHVIPVVADLGSGLLDANCPWLEHGPPAWLGDEPAVRLHSPRATN